MTINLRPYGLDTTDPAWEGLRGQPEVEIPGVYGPGGFANDPTLTGPASGPAPGTSLATTTPPLEGETGWFKPHLGANGQPEMLTGPGSISENNQKTLGQMNPFGFIGGGNPYWRGAIAAGGVLTPTPAETGEFHPPMVRGRPEAPMSSVHGNPAATPATYPHMPWPDTGVAPPVVSPAASPAVTRQRPNLGTYGAPPAAVANSPFILADRPNMSPQNSARGHQGAEQMGMLDLSRLFGGGQPAPAAAAPAAVPYPPPRPLVGNQPSIHMVNPGPSDPSIIARQRMKRPKSSSTSEGGGYNT